MSDMPLGVSETMAEVDRQFQAITAEFAGWSDLTTKDTGKLWGVRDGGYSVVPDYHKSLGVWHREVWPLIDADHRLAWRWWQQLLELHGEFDVHRGVLKAVNASARHRCMALALALKERREAKEPQ